MYKLEALKNGLRVAAKEMGRMESFSLGVWLRAGGRYEEKKNNGISHLLEHLLFKGTKKRDMKKIKEEIEGRGGSFNGFTSEEYTCYLVKLLAKDAELGVDILSDMVLDPLLADEEVEKEKGVIIEEINMYKDIPSQHVHEILTELLWPNQPLGMPLAGSQESVRSLTKKDLLLYKDSFYHARNMLLIGAGKIKDGDLVRLANKYFKDAAVKDAPKYQSARSEQTGPVIKVEAKDTEQTHVALGFRSMDRFHPDRYALSLLNIILGGNMSSKLFHTVRDEMALCYEISSSVRKHEDTGAFLISAGVDDTKLLKALEVIFKVIGSVKSQVVSEDELRRAKEYYRGQLLFALEDTMSMMLWLGEKISAGEKEFDIQKILKAVEDVGEDDLMRVALEIFKDENLNFAVIGPLGENVRLDDVLHVE